MTKQEFLDSLAAHLSALPHDELAATLEFYAEQLDDRVDDGMPEAQAVASLEPPETIAASILAQPASDTPRAPASAHATARRSWLAALTHVAAILGMAVAAPLPAACLLTLWVLDAAVLTAGLGVFLVGALSLISLVTAPPATLAVGIATFGVAVATTGIAVLLWALFFVCARLLFRLGSWLVRIARKQRAAARMRRLARKTAGEAAIAVVGQEPASPNGTPSLSEPATHLAPKRLAVSVVTCGLALIVAGCTLVAGSIASTGGANEFLRQAGTGELHPSLSIPGDQAGTIDLSFVNAPRVSMLSRQIYLGASPDENIHVIGTPTAWPRLYLSESSAQTLGLEASMVAFASQPVVEPQLNDRTISLVAERREGLYVQNPFAAYNAAHTQTLNHILVLVPDGWLGHIVATDNTALSLMSTGFATYDPMVNAFILPAYLEKFDPKAKFRTYGDLDLEMEWFMLSGIEAQGMSLTATGNEHTGWIQVIDCEVHNAITLSAPGDVVLDEDLRSRVDLSKSDVEVTWDDVG